MISLPANRSSSMADASKNKLDDNHYTQIQLLNEELIFTILSHLHQHPQTLKSFSLTCKSFFAAESTHRRSATLLRPDFLASILRRYPNLSHLDLSLCPRVDDSLLKTLASSNLIQSVKLTRCRFVTGSGISDLAPNLVEIDLSNAVELTDFAAAAIARARNLERLSLVRCKLISDMGIGCIAVGCRKLKIVNLKWCLRVSDLGVGLLAIKCSQIRSLDLSYVPITEKCLVPVLQLLYLEDLVLVGCLGVDDDGLSSLEEGCKSMKTLDLSNCQNISHIGLSNLIRGAGNLSQMMLSYGSAVTVDVAKSLQNFSALQCLKLDDCNVTCSALKMIGNWCASLRELSLTKCSGVTDEDISSIFKRHTELRKVDITCCRKITSVSIDSVTRFCTSLTCLKMEACNLVSKEAFTWIGQRCPFLEELDVTDDNLDDEGLKSISRCSRLLTLKLGICPYLTDEGLTQVGLGCSRLKELDLYGTMGITDVGIASIAQGCGDLESLNIAYCDKVTDASLISLSKCWRIKTLEMRGCPHITSVGLAAIASGCRLLTVLDIKKCYKIDNLGMIPLAHYSQNLKQINLSYCSVTDVGLLALASISRLQNMTILHLAGLSPNGLAGALLGCGGLKKVKLHTSLKALLPPSLLQHMETCGCVFQWRDKPFQPKVDSNSLEWNLQIGSHS